MRIRVYGFDECPMCKELRDLLEKDGINHVYINVYDKKYRDESIKVFKLATVEAVPIVLIGKMILAPDKSFTSIPHAHEIIKSILSKSDNT